MKRYIVTLKLELTDLKKGVSVADIPSAVEDSLCSLAKKMWELGTFADARVTNFKVKK